MLRGLMIVALVLTAVFALVLGVLRLQPKAHTLESAFGGCSSPCWYGMQPGITSYDETAARFDAIGWKSDSAFCRVLSSGCTDFRWWNPNQMGEWAGVHFYIRQLNGIAIQSPGLIFGQLMQALGAPQIAYQYLDARGRSIYYSALWNGIGAAVVLRCPTTFAALLRAPVEAVVLTQLTDPSVKNALPSFRAVCRS